MTDKPTMTQDYVSPINDPANRNDAGWWVGRIAECFGRDAPNKRDIDTVKSDLQRQLELYQIEIRQLRRFDGPTSRRIVQISSFGIDNNAAALCSDGSVWQFNGGRKRWECLPAVPQGEASPT